MLLSIIILPRLIQNIPVFVPLLHRIDSILLSLGLTLFLSAAYLPSPPFSSPHSVHTIPLPATFILLTLIHAALGVLHAPPVLARVGLPAAAYSALLVALALAFGGAGVWAGVW